MAEILNILFYPLPNAIMTFLTAISLLYWLFTMLMGEGFDFGTDSSVEFDGADIQDLDSDIDVDGEGHINHEPSFFAKALDFINLGKAPLMVIVTLFQFIGWIITIASSLLFELGEYGWKSVWVLIPIIIITYLLMHYVTIPVVKLYNNIGYMGEEAYDYLGRTGKMKSTIQGESIGLAEININKDIIRIHVKSTDGSKINYGDEIVIIKEDSSKKYYHAKKDINLNTF